MFRNPACCALIVGALALSSATGCTNQKVAPNTAKGATPWKAGSEQVNPVTGQPTSSGLMPELPPGGERAKSQ